MIFDILLYLLSALLTFMGGATVWLLLKTDVRRNELEPPHPSPEELEHIQLATEAKYQIHLECCPSIPVLEPGQYCQYCNWYFAPPETETFSVVDDPPEGMEWVAQGGGLYELKPLTPALPAPKPRRVNYAWLDDFGARWVHRSPHGTTCLCGTCKMFYRRKPLHVLKAYRSYHVAVRQIPEHSEKPGKAEVIDAMLGELNELISATELIETPVAELSDQQLQPDHEAAPITVRFKDLSATLPFPHCRERDLRRQLRRQGWEIPTDAETFLWKDQQAHPILWNYYLQPGDEIEIVDRWRTPSHTASRGPG